MRMDGIVHTLRAYFFSHLRLLDVIHINGRYPHEMILYLVFEHMEQDLDCFIQSSFPAGIGEETVKVRVSVLETSN